MIYKNFKSLKLSAIGMGAMRLPVTGSDANSPIDEAETEKMVGYAIENGVNYFDTAWGYHGGKSEAVMGNALKKYPRESWYLADKFPGYDLSNMDKVKEIFEEQLKRCGVEYFDFYFVHNVCELNIDAYLDKKYGIYDYLVKQKQNGRIKYLGFSAHGNCEVMRRFLKVYGGAMEFCQIQLNYIDWTLQSAKEKLDLLKKNNIPVWVMEPMRGGQLASLSEENAAKLKASRPDETIPAWSFRFIQSLTDADIIVTLTGASSFEQLKDNIKTYREEKPLNQAELKVLTGVAENMMSQKATLPCTACRYCAGYCPLELDIPHLLSLYNDHNFTGGGFLAAMALQALPEEKLPQSCASCRKCEEVCPQQIKISEAMADFAAKTNK